MKKLIIICCLLAGCTEGERAQLRNFLGGKAYIRCYSGGKLIYEGNSTGKVTSEDNSDGYIFRDSKTGNLIEVSADCVFTYE